ncbi:MAG: 4a-hydroxytetrahydrobiopterin dehydratase [Candidatus Kapaibacterium sp.]|jgi:4a-hydroxytetrahydrobiopterin dehydratase
MLTKLPQAEVETKLEHIGNGWEYCEKHNAIEKEYVRENFLDCVNFIQDIAMVAEEADHHPDLLLHDYKKLRVTLSTHDAGGITNKDFEVAQSIDKIS